MPKIAALYPMRKKTSALTDIMFFTHNDFTFIKVSSYIRAGGPHGSGSGSTVLSHYRSRLFCRSHAIG